MRKQIARVLWWAGSKLAPCRYPEGTDVRDWELNMWFRGTQAEAEKFWLDWQDAACELPSGCAAQGGSMCPIEDEDES